MNKLVVVVVFAWWSVFSLPAVAVEGMPWKVYAKISNTTGDSELFGDSWFFGKREARLNVNAEQGVDLKKIGKFTLNSYAKIGVSASSNKLRYWDNKSTSSIGVQLVSRKPMGDWGNVKIGSTVERSNYFSGNPPSGYNGDVRVVFYVTTSFGGDHK